MKNLLCMILRVVTLGSKFILMLFLSRNITPTELGIYSLLFSSIMWALYFVGYDFYVINIREILAKEESLRPLLIRDQLVFYLCAYVLVLPILFLLFVFNILPHEYILFFYALLITEHLAQEGDRLLITFSKQTQANIAIFIRGGLWVYGIIAVSLLAGIKVDLRLVFSGWLLADILAICFIALQFRELNWKIIFDRKINWAWIWSSTKKATVFFITTMCLQAIMYNGQFFLKFYGSYAEVGIYAYFCSLVNAIPIFASVGIFSFMMPELVSSYGNNDLVLFKKTVKKMTNLCLMYIVVATLLGVIGIYFVLFLTGKDIYFASIRVYWILLIAVVFNVLSNIPHYILYAKKQDKFLLYSTASAAIFSCIANVFMARSYHIMGIATTLLLSYLILFVMKGFMLYNCEGKLIFSRS